MNSFWQDLRYGLRMLRARPAFTLVAVLTLSLGIGATTAIFSAVNALLLRPLPYPQPERLVWIWERNPGSAIEDEPISLPNYRDWRAQNESFSELTAWGRTTVVMTGTGEPERIMGAVVVTNFFPTFGAQMALGRGFLPEENTPGRHRVAVISHGLFQRRFGGNPQIVGESITLNGTPHTIVGVLTPDFKHPEPGQAVPPEFWLPLSIVPAGDAAAGAGRRSDYLRVVGRLKNGVSIERARAEMETIAARLAQEYPAANAGWSPHLLSLHERFVGNIEKALLLLLGAVAFLLLIACANVASLLLARAAAREREIAVRAALGAGRARLLRQFLTESTMLSLIGGAAGLLLAYWGVEALVAIAPDNLPRLDEISISRPVLIFTLGISLLTGLIFGIAPALSATRFNLNESLKDGGRSAGEGRRGGRLRSAVIVTEIALSAMLLVGAGLMIRSFIAIAGVDPGFRPERVLTFQTLLPQTKYPEGPQISAFYESLIERLRSLPGVESAAAINTVPLAGGGSYLSIAIEGRPAPPPEKVEDAEVFVSSPGYLSTLGIPLVRGEDFSSQHGASTSDAAIINEALARRYFPDTDPIGKKITLGNPQTGPWLTIIGLVKDVQHSDLTAAPYPQMYLAQAQNPRRLMTMVVRAAGDPLALTAAVRSEVRAMDAELPLSRVETLEQIISDSIARPRFNTQLLGIFAAVGLLLSAIGIYGVISYSVAQRTHEIGIRISLGAGRGDVLRLVLGQGLKMAAAGVVLGLAGAAGLVRLMTSLLFQVSAFDPLTFLGVAALLVGVSAAACYIPARRAMRVDPMIALRYE